MSVGKSLTGALVAVLLTFNAAAQTVTCLSVTSLHGEIRAWAPVKEVICSRIHLTLFLEYYLFSHSFNQPASQPVKESVLTMLTELHLCQENKLSATSNGE